jgi:hypothetical protein
MNRFVTFGVPWASHSLHEHPPAAVDLIGRSAASLSRSFQALTYPYRPLDKIK